MIELKYWLGFKLGLLLAVQITFVCSGITFQQLTRNHTIFNNNNEINNTWALFNAQTPDDPQKQSTNSTAVPRCEVYMLTVMNDYNEQVHQQKQGLNYKKSKNVTLNSLFYHYLKKKTRNE